MNQSSARACQALQGPYWCCLGLREFHYHNYLGAYLIKNGFSGWCFNFLDCPKLPKPPPKFGECLGSMSFFKYHFLSSKLGQVHWFMPVTNGDTEKVNLLVGGKDRRKLEKWRGYGRFQGRESKNSRGMKIELPSQLLVGPQLFKYNSYCSRRSIGNNIPLINAHICIIYRLIYMWKREFVFDLFLFTFLDSLPCRWYPNLKD